MSDILQPLTPFSSLLFLWFSFNPDLQISHPPPSFLRQPCFIAERESCICAPSTVSNLLCLFHKSELKVVLRRRTYLFMFMCLLVFFDSVYVCEGLNMFVFGSAVSVCSAALLQTVLSSCASVHAQAILGSAVMLPLLLFDAVLLRPH